MTNHTTRLLITYSAILCGLLLFVTPVHAAETSWNWHDISSQLTVRQNRPVWTMAYAKGTYYLGDGQSFLQNGHIWTMKGTKVTDITSQIQTTGLTRVDSIFVKDSSLVFAGVAGLDKAYGTYNGDSYSFNMGSVDKPGIPDALKNLNLDSSSLTAWDGKAWMIISGKNIMRYDGTTLTSLGRTRDYFTCLTSDGQGSFLLGGAASSIDSDSPSMPLSAKLVRVSEGNQSLTYAMAGNFGTIRGTSNKINYWAWNEPNTLRNSNTVSPKYSVGAQSNKGIRGIEIYANGKLVKYCDGKNSKKNVVCQSEINGDAYGYESDVALSASIIASNGNRASVAPRAIRFYDTTVHANGVLDGALYTATATVPSGLAKIDIYLNGKIINTCNYFGQYDAQTCTYAINKNQFVSGTSIALNAHAIGINGMDAWTELSNLDISSATPDYPSTQAQVAKSDKSRVYAWFWTEPTGNQMPAGTTKLFVAQALSLDGLKKIDILVNGAIKRTCEFNGQKDMQTCETTVLADDYAVNSSVPLTIVATDVNRQTVTTDAQYLIANSNQSAKYSLSSWLQISGPLNMTKIDNRTISAGGDGTNGIKQVEILTNGNVQETCVFYDRSMSHSCQTVLNGNSWYTNMGFMAVNARVTDLAGNISWSPTYVINVMDVKLRPAEELNAQINLDPAGDILRPDQNKQVTVKAHALAGVNQINIFINNILWQTCDLSGANGTDQTCGIELSGNMYKDGAWLNLNASVVDKQGYTTWATAELVKIQSPGTNYPDEITLSIDTDPAGLNLFSNKTTTIVAYADAPQGITSVELSADGKPLQACHFAAGSPDFNCRADFQFSSAPYGTEVTVHAKATDVYGNIKEVDKKYSSQ